MRVGFLLAILFGAGYYSYVAFVDLNFLSSAGRLGPGFFPRLIGVLLVACCLVSLFVDVKAQRGPEGESPYWPIVGVMALLSGILVLMLNILGGPLAMALFLFVTLMLLNRGHLVQNLAIAILLPTGIYFLFDVWLNAAMPEGVVPLPI